MSNHGTLSDRSLDKRRVSKHNVGKPTLKTKIEAPCLRLPRVPIEWYGSDGWRLPSGKALGEFALQAGFLAPLLFKSEGFGSPGLSGLACESTRPSRSFKKAEPV